MHVVVCAVPVVLVVLVVVAVLVVGWVVWTVVVVVVWTVPFQASAQPAILCAPKVETEDHTDGWRPDAMDEKHVYFTREGTA